MGSRLLQTWWGRITVSVMVWTWNASLRFLFWTLVPQLVALFWGGCRAVRGWDLASRRWLLLWGMHQTPGSCCSLSESWTAVAYTASASRSAAVNKSSVPQGPLHGGWDSYDHEQLHFPSLSHQAFQSTPCRRNQYGALKTFLSDPRSPGGCHLTWQQKGPRAREHR